MAIAQSNAPWQARELAKLVFVGHVDHGKSSLIGRLLYDTDSLPEGKFEELKAMSERRGMPLEWSFLLDAFQAERDQAVTIDTTQIQFKTDRRDYTIIDAPGHKEFLKNMVTGAANADAAVLVVDAREGVQEQTRRHGYLLHILGIKQVAVAVNKMDLMDFDEQRFADVTQEVTTYLQSIGVEPTYFVPISARDGDNIAERSSRTPWFEGRTVLEALDSFHVLTIPTEQPLRLPVQDVYKFDDRRLIAGRIESGILRTGDTILFSPSNKTVRVRSIEAFNRDPNPVEARAGECVSITLDEQLFLERGEIASHEDNAPRLTNVFKGRIFWFGHEPLEAGKTLKVKLATREARVTVQAIDSVIDTDTLAAKPAEQVERNQIAEVVLRSKQVLAVDEFHEIMRTGRFVLIDGYDAVAGGVLSMEGYPDQRRALQVKSTNVYSVEHRVPAEARHERNGHIGGVMWFTGLSGAGKSTLAMEVENHLFRKGYQVYVLDGDNVRRGLNANLGFSPDDRAENIRRVGEAAALFADAGFIVITSFISPYRADRERARAAGRGQFHEIYVHADLETCEKRDPKGLYRRARAGEIQDFTGIHAPYEHPVDPELVVDTTGEPVESCAQKVLEYVEQQFSLHPSKRAEVV